MSEEMNRGRRRFLISAAASIAGPELTSGSAWAQSTDTKSGTGTLKPQANTSFAPLKQIEAGLLSVGYAEQGPANGPPVLLLHGWPYDIYSFVDVAPLLASAGYRVIVPYLRGYGTTRFLSNDTFRNAQQAAVALDIIALMDALKIEKPVIGAFDWGARTANIIAALWPERCKGMVSVSGYLIGNPEANRMPSPPKGEFDFWYRYYFVTERGRLGYEKYRRDFNKLIWQQASPKWVFDDATYDRSAAAFDNPDHVAIVIHNYRWRIALAPGEPQYDDLERLLLDFFVARESPFAADALPPPPDDISFTAFPRINDTILGIRAVRAAHGAAYITISRRGSLRSTAANSALHAGKARGW